MTLRISLSPFSQDDAVSLRTRAERFGLAVLSDSSPDRSLEHDAGRLALTDLLLKEGIEPAFTLHGKMGFPEIKTPGYYASISHTKGLAVAALASKPVGIDVELGSRNVSRLLKRIRHKEETALWPHLTGPLEDVPLGIGLWTGKEAYSKALGLGIQLPFSQIRISFEHSLPYPVTSPKQVSPQTLQDPHVCWRAKDGFVIACCTEGALLKELFFNPEGRVKSCSG